MATSAKKNTQKTVTKKQTFKKTATKKSETPAKAAVSAAKKSAKTTVRKTKVTKAAPTKRRKTAVSGSAVSAKAKKAVVTVKNTSKNEKISALTGMPFWGKQLEKMALHSKTAALLLGVLLTAALPPFFYTFTLFLAFSGALFLACKTEKVSRLAAIGYWFGFGYFAIGFYWIGNALLVDVTRTGWLYPLVLFLNGAFFGLFTILPFVATKLGKNVFSKAVWLAVVWCLVVEWLRSFILTGFPWNPVSSVLAFSPTLMQVLAFVGTHGTSLLLVFFAAFPAAWLINLNRKRLYAIGGVVLSFWAILWIGGGYILENRPRISAGESLVIRLVQPSIPQALKWDRSVLEKNLQAYIDLSNGKDKSYLDFIIWGETATPFDLISDEVHNRKVSSVAPPYGYLITGFLRRVDDGYRYIPYNSFGVFNRKGELVGYYDKNHLVPFGEYIPFRKYLPEWVKPVANVVAEFGRGEKFKTLKIANIPAFAPLICYEIIFSDEVVQKGVQKPTWAVVLTNDGWYGNSSGPYQHLAAAQMRAVEEGITVVRGANSGISAVINPYGEIVAQIPLGVKAAVDALIKPKEARQTLFGQYGNKIPLTMCGTLILLALLCRLFSRSEKS